MGADPIRMVTLFWVEFGALFAAALAGGAAVLPFSLQLLKSSAKDQPLTMPVPKLLLLSFLQTVVLSAIAIGVGLVAARAIGLGAPYIEALIAGMAIPPIAPMLTAALTLGALSGAFLILMDIAWLPRLPKALLDSARDTSLPQNFAASLYGGINEEFLIRLLGMSAVAWLLSRIWHTQAGLPTDTVFWTANIVMAVGFGLGHLPAIKKLVDRITPFLLTRTLFLNGALALACGWLYWHYGIEAAIIAHFTADIVCHVVGTVVLRLNDRYHFRQVS